MTNIIWECIQMDSTQLQNLHGKGTHDAQQSKARGRVSSANMREGSFRSIGDIAEELKVSKQCWCVAQMLGFSGYSELKTCLQKAILEQINPAALLASGGQQQRSFPRAFYRAEHANLDDTMAQLTRRHGKFCELVSRKYVYA